MGPYFEMVCSGYIWIPDLGYILRTKGFDLRQNAGYLPSIVFDS